MTVRPLRSVRRWSIALMLVLTAAACGGGSDAPEVAEDCRRPSLAISAGGSGGEDGATAAPQVAGGSRMTVTGTAFGEGCIPSDGADGDEDAAPMDKLHLFVAQGAERISVAQVSPGSELGFETLVGIPASLQPGPAQLRAQSSTEPDADAVATLEFVVAER